MAVDDDLDLDVDDDAGDGGGGSKKKLIIIIAIVVLVLVISGVATMLMLGGGDDKPASAAEGEAAGGDTAAEEMKMDAMAPLIYFPLSKPFVVSFGPDSDVRFLQVEVQIATRSPVMATKIRENEPAIRNNLVLLLSSQDSTALSTREGKEKLRAQVLAEIKTVMKGLVGSDAIDNVFFTNFVMQ